MEQYEGFPHTDPPPPRRPSTPLAVSVNDPNHGSRFDGRSRLRIAFTIFALTCLGIVAGGVGLVALLGFFGEATAWMVFLTLIVVGFAWASWDFAGDRIEQQKRRAERGEC